MQNIGVGASFALKKRKPARKLSGLFSLDHTSMPFTREQVLELAKNAGLFTGDVLRGANNEIAGIVSGPVDLIAAGLNKVGAPVGSEPFGGSAWMARQGLTSPVDNQAAGLLGQVAGLVAPSALAAKAPQVAGGLLALIDDLRGGSRAMRSAAETPLESVTYTSANGKMNDLGDVPQRPFHDDYPGTVRGDVGQPLESDIDGRFIDPGATVAGRRTVGGPDSPLSPGEVDDLLTRLGVDWKGAPRSSAALQGDSGRYVRGPGKGGQVSRNIWYAADLPREQAQQIIRHELGHAAEDMSFGQVMPTDGIKKELRSIYEQSVTPGNFKPGRGLTPESFGYSGPKVDSELFAEAFRNYISNPNAIKSKFPKTAARLRDYINTNPNLNKYLHLNSLAPVAPLGLLSLTGDTDTPDDSGTP
jgi:hypothetical protein